MTTSDTKGVKMGRKSAIGFYASRGGYFTTYAGNRHRLHSCSQDDRPDGANFLAAMKEFGRLMERAAEPSTGDDSVSASSSRWLAHFSPDQGKTVEVCRTLTRGFVEAYGRVAAPDITVRQVLDHVDRRKTWSPATRGECIRRLRAMFKWNRDNLYIAADPLARMPRQRGYAPKARGAEFCLPDDLVALILQTPRQPFRELCTVLARTGARPSELRLAVRANYRPADKAIVHRGNETRLYVHKTARSKRGGDSDRWIYLDDECDAIVARNAARGNVLFPAPRGGAWSEGALFQAWKRMQERGAVADWLTANEMPTEYVVPYSLRHTFITNAIKKGLSIKLVADLCGTSVLMIERHYSHAAADRGAMRKYYLACL